MRICVIQKGVNDIDQWLRRFELRSTNEYNILSYEPFLILDQMKLEGRFGLPAFRLPLYCTNVM